MPLVPMNTLLQHARKNHYAVGYFEAWNFESLLAVIDAAEEKNSPVIIGFNGGFLGNEERRIPENIKHYGALVTEAAAHSKVPVSTIFNESGSVPDLIAALKAGFLVIMHDHECCSHEESISINQYLVRTAHYQGAEVEAEIGQLPAADHAGKTVSEGELTDPAAAIEFVMQTEVDALAVSVGNVHMLEGNKKSNLDLDLVEELRSKIAIPLVLHGGTGADEDDLRRAIKLGVSKINIGTVLRRAFINSLKEYYQNNEVDDLDPNEITSTGGPRDMLVRARKAVAGEVIRFIDLLGSSGQSALR